MHKISAKTDHSDDLHRSPLQITSSAPLSSCAASAAVAFSVSKVAMALRRASAWSEREKTSGKSMDAIDSIWIYHGGKKGLKRYKEMTFVSNTQHGWEKAKGNYGKLVLK